MSLSRLPACFILLIVQAACSSHSDQTIASESLKGAASDTMLVASHRTSTSGQALTKPSRSTWQPEPLLGDVDTSKLSPLGKHLLYSADKRILVE